MYLGSTPISWKSRKQHNVARSSIETEYKAFVDGTAKILWIRSLLLELRLSSSSMTMLWCDNLRATFLSTNLVFHVCIKHVKLIITLFVIMLLSKKFMYDSFLPRTN
jgi:hypothetical protein